jgi:glycine cleavage system H protein|uniref:Glycine cleavage system H protein n=1 Tax=candidate division WOR-3 bacterium TaxID=2052148 RepID=A0A7C3YTI1_UNCW3
MSFVPEDLFYTKTHEWVKIEGDIALSGITDFAQKELSDIVYVDVTEIGRELKQGERYGTIEAVKTVSDLYLPISGEILEVNELLKSEPGIINQDPYKKGWIIKIKVKDKEEIKNLLKPEEYKRHIGE